MYCYILLLHESTVKSDIENCDFYFGVKQFTNTTCTDSCSGHTVNKNIEYFDKFSRVLAPIYATYQPRALRHEIAYSVNAEECDELVSRV